MKKIIGLLIISSIVGAVPAFAENCDSISCPSGQAVVSFGDGNSAQCMCVEEGSGMVPTNEISDGCVDSDDDGTCD